MSKSRHATAPETTEDLAEVVAAFTDEVRVLRQAIDDLREEIRYAANNLLDRPEPPLPHHHRRIVSVPLDPTANDFAGLVNAVSASDLPPEPHEERRDPTGADSAPSPPPGRLF